MQNIISVELTRDCEATQIPSGALTTLPKGAQVDITQNLGGSYTVHVAGGGLYRIPHRDGDALGFKPAPEAAAAAPAADKRLDEKAVWDVLRTCYDPEIPVNIVDLGLVYDMRIEPGPDGKRNVRVKMTLTAPGCGMGGVIAGEAQEKLLRLSGVHDATVEIVWEPAWNPSLISEEGRKRLGLE